MGMDGVGYLRAPYGANNTSDKSNQSEKKRQVQSPETREVVFLPPMLIYVYGNQCGLSTHCCSVSYDKERQGKNSGGE